MKSMFRWAAVAVLLAACSDPVEPESSTPEQAIAEDSAPEPAATEDAPVDPQLAGRRFAGELEMPGDLIVGDAARNAGRRAYFGDLHVHTEYSFDAFAFGTIASPDDAYRYAQGEPLRHPGGFDVQLSQPLDFYAVTDHAMFLGAVREAADTSTEFSKLPHVQALHNLNAPENMTAESVVRRGQAFASFLPETLRGVLSGSIDGQMMNAIARDAWSDIIRAAEANYRPGEFTTFVAYEYTSTTDDRGNLHRNVVFRGSDKLPAMPFSRFHSQNPEGLWDWMDGLRSQGIESLAIPHNSNGSNGQMFKLVDWAGDPLDDAYAEQRMRNEPVIELTQVKGTSETHPALSDNDEWADFEIMPYRIATMLDSAPSGSYAREALLNGIVLEEQGVANPYQFGFIGASDTHTGAAYIEEDNYFSKAGLLDADGQRRGSLPLTEAQVEVIETADRFTIKEVDGNKYSSGAYETWGASGVTGVWAEENTREAIYDAFRRKETFATSGPRMTIRLFAGFDYTDALLDRANLADAYAAGAAMGSELLADGDRPPKLLVSATRDANSAPLQRLQIIKGWVQDGAPQERVYDVACAGGAPVDSATQRCPDNGAGVDLATCATTGDVGAARLQTLWQDPDFDPEQRAFYYARVLENPTCRWSTWDAVRAGMPPRADLAATIQERAWSSPIWYEPAR